MLINGKIYHTNRLLDSTWKRGQKSPNSSVDLIQFFSSVQFSLSVMSDSWRPHELQHTRPPCPSPTPGVHPNPRPILKKRRYFCACVFSCIQHICDPMDCSPLSSSVCGISQARILKWVAVSYSRGPSWPRDQTCVSCISCIGRQILYHWATCGVCSNYCKVHMKE